jgi:hypothetical protein
VSARATLPIAPQVSMRRIFNIFATPCGWLRRIRVSGAGYLSGKNVKKSYSIQK